jgi:hypothetical protein
VEERTGSDISLTKGWLEDRDLGHLWDVSFVLVPIGSGGVGYYGNKVDIFRSGNRNPK